MTKEKKLWLQIPTEVVRNIGFEIDEKAFAVYTSILFAKFKLSVPDNEVVKFKHSEMKNLLHINDGRTIKKALMQLCEQGLIIWEQDNLPRNGGNLEITPLQPFKKNWFTQLPINLNLHIGDIGLIGYRLMYYYESHINRKIVTKDYCYPSYETIMEDLQISDKTLTKYNELLKKEKLITVTKHKVHFDNPFDEGIFDRYNNHYRVNLLNIK